MSTETLQVVDFDGNWNTETAQFVESSGLARVGREYATVGVFGGQSSGKSTLLNLLFGTGFEVMNATIRKQTTQGIWLSRAKDLPLFILDIEGTDSAARGEDHMAFERKSSLLAMALCDVVIVNMWEHDVGRQDAANLTLLRTVFEVNLQLRTDSTRTLLLFVLRDRSQAPLEMLEQTIRGDVSRVWRDVAKVSQTLNILIYLYMRVCSYLFVARAIRTGRVLTVL